MCRRRKTKVGSGRKLRNRKRESYNLTIQKSLSIVYFHLQILISRLHLWDDFLSRSLSFNFLCWDFGCYHFSYIAIFLPLIPKKWCNLASKWIISKNTQSNCYCYSNSISITRDYPFILVWICYLLVLNT